MFKSYLLIAAIIFWAAPAHASSVYLTQPQRAKLAALVRNDAEAANDFVPVRQTADDALGDNPNPIALVQSEGKLAGDPLKIRTWKSLADMNRIQALTDAWAVTNDQKYASKLREFVLTWTSQNRSAGDPIDDTNLEPLIIACDTARELFTSSEWQQIDRYLRQLAEAEIKTGQGPAHTNVNNWNSHRVKLVGLAAFTLQDRALIDLTIKSYEKQIRDNLLPDGSSIDFHERDALHYHEYDLRPLLVLAIATRNNKYDFYHYRSPTGSSLAKSVQFMVPFADGSQIHPEFVHSTVDFDRQRAANGERDYKAGRPWNRYNALLSIELAEQFDPSLLPLVKNLAKSTATKYPTWQTVINSARQ